MAGIKELDTHSRVWVYQSNREFTSDEAEKIKAALDNFTSGWAAHGNQLVAGAELRYRRFILLAVDEAKAGASGCSIDSSVRFIKGLEQEYHIDLMDRMLFATREAEMVKVYNRAAFEDAIEKGRITGETHVFNNLVKDKGELDAAWEIPLSQSWHASFFSGNLARAAEGSRSK